MEVSHSEFLLPNELLVCKIDVVRCHDCLQPMLLLKLEQVILAFIV
jgi:hypothetical protein